MGRLRRGKRAAIKAALLSEFYAHRVGVALFKGSKPIHIGFNKHKSHPQSVCFTQHAEFSALLKRNIRNDSKNLTMFVARLTRTNKIRLAKPCAECQKLLLSVGISKVYFTNHKGNLEELVYDLSALVA